MPSIRTNPYVRVLSRPRVLGTFMASLMGRSAYSLVFLPLFYTAERASGSVAFAGLVIAVYGASASFLAPVRAWLIDRLGARSALTYLVVAFSGMLVVTSLIGAVEATSGAIVSCAALAGIVAPPLGPTMRVAWAQLLPDKNDLRVGLSLDAVVEEVLYLVGPAVGGFLLIGLAPWQVMAVPAVLVFCGGLIFVSTKAVSSMKSHSESGSPPRQGRLLLSNRYFVALLLPPFVAGGISGMVSIVVPAAEGLLGGTGVVGIALGVFAAGSAVGGLCFGVLKLSGTLSQQLIIGCGMFVVAASALAWLTNALYLSVALAVAGLFFSPVMIIAYIAVPALAPKYQQNAATTWVNTSHNLGSAAVSIIAGLLVQSCGPTVSVVAVSIAALLILVLAQMLLSIKPARSTHSA